MEGGKGSGLGEVMGWCCWVQSGALRAWGWEGGLCTYVPFRVPFFCSGFPERRWRSDVPTGKARPWSYILSTSAHTQAFPSRSL